jgi:hypothetical protein
MEQAYLFPERLFLSAGQATHCWQASIPVLKYWIRVAWRVACMTLGGHCRITLEWRLHSLRQSSLFLSPISALSICILIISRIPAITKLFSNLGAKEADQGTGLGLAIYGRIVPEHHGTMELSSNEPGDNARLDAAAHQWLKRAIYTRTHVVGQSAECPQEWKSVSIP